MPFTDYPDKFLRYNDQQTKNLNMVVVIEDAPDILGLVNTYTKIRYGDPIKYGDPGIVYGGLRKADNQRSYLSVQSNLTIGQRIEPEQGKGSVGIMNLVFVDVDGYISQLLSRNVVLDEPINKMVRVRLGYVQTSYPEDYFTVFRGYISGIKTSPGLIHVQISDPQAKRRAQVFFTPTTRLDGNIDNSTTTIPVVKTDGFYQHILGPNLAYDVSVKTYIQIDDEIMFYGPGGVGPANFTTVVRGSRGTGAASHTADTEVSNKIELSGNCIDIALKIMLSGWNGPWKENQTILSIANTLGGPTNMRVIMLPNNVDAKDDLGLSSGDYVYVTGSTAGNDGTKIVSSILSLNDRKNNAILVTTDFASVEFPATAVRLAFRSKYDVLPIAAGLKMKPTEIEVDRFELIRNQFFSQNEYRMRFYLDSATSGKDFIDSQIMLPIGAYSISRFGLVSITTTKPPIAGEKLIVLSKDTIVAPEQISVERSTNNRKFFNEVQYSYDKNDAGEYTTVDDVLDTESLTKVDQSSVLPIKADGLRTDLSAPTLIARQAKYLVNRYKNCALLLDTTAIWGTGVLIETGDVVLLVDEGNLHITNFENGTRNIGTQLFEAIDVQKDPKTGLVKLKLLSNLGYQITDRFATISPSSLLDNGSTTSALKIKDSFGALYPGNERLKWIDLLGEKLIVHSYDWSFQEETSLVDFDTGDDYRMLINPPLSIAPPSDYIVDIGFYPNSVDPLEGKLSKLLFSHLTPTIDVVSGADDTHFDVAPSDASQFTVGLPVIVHNDTYGVLSNEVFVKSIAGPTIETATSLGFTPSGGERVDLIGYIDGGGPYRWL
jgi:hypothetical protein